MCPCVIMKCIFITRSFEQFVALRCIQGPRQLFSLDPHFGPSLDVSQRLESKFILSTNGLLEDYSIILPSFSIYLKYTLVSTNSIDRSGSWNRLSAELATELLGRHNY